MSLPDPRIAILGGTGFTDLDSVTIRRRERVDTPFGAPSAPLIHGELDGNPVVFLSRHGPNHELLPSEVPVRANLYALKRTGARRVLGISAVGSLREPVTPGELAVPDQLIDHTRSQPASFFGEGLVAHVSVADPFCPQMLRMFREREAPHDAPVGGTYVTIGGPQFSSQAESERYRKEGGDLIGMTVGPEARLAREAELCYASLTMVTDYDAWRGESATAETEQIIQMLQQIQGKARAVVEWLIPILFRENRDCPCGSALEGSLITPPEAVPERTLRRLELLLPDGSYDPDG